jgi:type IV pili sensor histidine kinase/response regulator
MKKWLFALSMTLALNANAGSMAVNIDALQVPVRTIFPTHITHVEQAVTWLIEPMGYRILTDYPAPESAKILLSKPIPAAAKMHRTMAMVDAIQLLIGEENTIILDNEHQLITFSRGN